MNEIYKIALNTFRETVRDKILYNILFFAIMMFGVSYFVSQWAALGMCKVLQDFSLSIISIFGIVISIFMGISLVYKEIEKKTVYVLISKPIKRWYFIVGKFLGISLTLLVNTLFLTLISVLTIKIMGVEVTTQFVAAALLTYFEMLVVLAISILFSSFSTPFVSLIFTILVVITGKLSYDILLYADKMMEKGDLLYGRVLHGIYYIVPNLDNFNLRTRVVNKLDISWEVVGFAIMYGIIFVVFYLTISSIAFSKRDMK